MTGGRCLHDRDSVCADVATTIGGLNIQTVRTAPRSPWQNTHAERVIGSIRRECLDHVIVMDAATGDCVWVAHAVANPSRARQGHSLLAPGHTAVRRSYRRHSRSHRSRPPLLPHRRVGVSHRRFSYSRPYPSVQHACVAVMSWRWRRSRDHWSDVEAGRWSVLSSFRLFSSAPASFGDGVSSHFTDRLMRPRLGVLGELTTFRRGMHAWKGRDAVKASVRSVPAYVCRVPTRKPVQFKIINIFVTIELQASSAS